MAGCKMPHAGGTTDAFSLQKKKAMNADGYAPSHRCQTVVKPVADDCEFYDER